MNWLIAILLVVLVAALLGVTHYLAVRLMARSDPAAGAGTDDDRSR